MIHFFARERSVVKTFLESWADQLVPWIKVRSYGCLLRAPSVRPGVHILTDFDRLRPSAFARARRLAAGVRKNGSRLLNDPGRWTTRLELLRQLSARGVNDFRAFQLSELDQSVRYPVFLRSAVDHHGAISDLLHSRDEVDRALSRLSLKNRLRKKHLLAVEYCDCSDRTGLFRKYAVMKIGSVLIPRHTLFSQDWVTKKPDIVNDHTLAEEYEFVKGFPHREEVAKVFDLAGVDYGRMDFGVKNGRIQVWEINTNPILVPNRGKMDPRRVPLQAESATRIIETLLALARRPS